MKRPLLDFAFSTLNDREEEEDHDDTDKVGKKLNKCTILFVNSVHSSELVYHQ